MNSNMPAIDQTFAELYDKNNNAFDFARFILATMVIYSHSFPLFYGAAKAGDTLAHLTNFQMSFGGLAVDGFFIVSGFLITQSLLNSRSYLDYLIKRVLRIFPALIAVTLFVGNHSWPVFIKCRV